MAYTVKIRDNVYPDCSQVDIPINNSEELASFYDIHDTTLQSGAGMLYPLTAYDAAGVKQTGSIQTKSGSDISVSGNSVTTPAGYYASQVTKQVASGSATPPASISGSGASVTAANNTLTLEKTVAVTPQVSEGYVDTGTAGNTAVTLSASVPTKSAETFHPSSSDQSIAADTYLTGAQTFKGVTVSGLSASNIVAGVTVKIGDADDDDRIASVSGTAQIPIISQDSTTKVLTIS